MPDPRYLSLPRPLIARIAAAAILILALPTAALRAQEPVLPPDLRDTLRVPESVLLQLAPGTRVRFTLEGYREYRVAGQIDSVLADAFVVDTADRRGFLFIAPGPELLPRYRQMRVRFDEIDVAEVSRGRNRWQGALRWGLVGAAAGGLITGLSGGQQYNPNGRDMLSAASSGIIVGGIVGGTMGYFRGREKWTRVR
ncbi:MAG TPA: hypothetical protein VGE02_15070 [Gemmatimonadales bacterium]